MFEAVEKNKHQDQPTAASGGALKKHNTPASAQPASTGSGDRQKSLKVEDMFSDQTDAATKEVPKPHVFQPKESFSADQLEEDESPEMNFRKYFVAGGILLALILVFAGGWYGFKNFSGLSGSKNDVFEQADEVLSPDQDNQDQQDDNFLVQPETPQQPALPPISPEQDSDDDGLFDFEEKELGTNPLLVDSDDDGLFDFEEVKVYGSDPLKKDTDGDGYLDGQEVKGGYNPLGWGKLFDRSSPNP